MTKGISEKHVAGEYHDTLMEMIMKVMGDKNAHCHALLLLWALQANAIPVSLRNVINCVCTVRGM